jgi:hypothetical protein
MEAAGKCPNCGLDLSGTQGAICPACGAQVALQARRNIWLGALVQFATIVTVLLLFRVPRLQSVFFGLFSSLAVLAANILTRKAAVNARTRSPLPNSAGSRTVIFALLFCCLGLVCSLLFGFVVFINSWNSWHRYEGQPFHRAEFVVEQDYYQPYSKAADLYASGTVEGHQEWMDLVPYLRSKNLYQPHGRGELESWVPPGTSIPIYLFPNLKGRSRVRLYDDTPPAEAYHRAAMNAVHYSLGGVALCAVTILLLLKIRAGYSRQSAHGAAFSSEL